MKVFKIHGEISEEGKIDEIVTRTASVLHTYAIVMNESSIYRGQSLYKLLHIVVEKKLSIGSQNFVCLY